MKYGKANHMEAPTIFMTACGATQTAAEAFFPISDTIPERNEDLDEKPESSSGLRVDEFISFETGYALLIGINNYESISPLKGCINDVINVGEKLLSLGWDPRRMKVLVDEQATKSGILEGINWLVSHSEVNDSLWFDFSGHGSWSLLKNGQGWECCICCQDCNPDDWDNGIITRTEFITALERPSGNLSVKLDSCFSGGMTPYYPAQKELPAVVYNILYRDIPAGRYSSNLRAVPGPEWLTKAKARCRMKLTRIEFRNLLRSGSVQTRKVLNGQEYVLVNPQL
mgnify:CR=1 FL=1